MTENFWDWECKCTDKGLLNISQYNGQIMTLLGVEDVVVSGSVEDVDVGITVLREVVMDSLVTTPSVKIHHPDLDTCRRSQA